MWAIVWAEYTHNYTTLYHRSWLTYVVNKHQLCMCICNFKGNLFHHNHYNTFVIPLLDLLFGINYILAYIRTQEWSGRR